MTREEKKLYKAELKTRAQRMQKTINDIISAYGLTLTDIGSRTSLPIATVHYICERDIQKPTKKMEDVYRECIRMMNERDIEIARLKADVTAA